MEKDREYSVDMPPIYAMTRYAPKSFPEGAYKKSDVIAVMDKMQNVIDYLNRRIGIKSHKVRMYNQRIAEVEAELAAEREKTAKLKVVMKECYIVMSGKEGSNNPFDAERWSKAVISLESTLAREPK